MEKKNLKRNIMIMIVSALIFVFGTYSLGTSETIDIELGSPREDYVESTQKDESVGNSAVIEKVEEKNDSVKSEETELNDASETIIGSVDKKTKRIAELTDKYNDKLFGTVAYYFEVIQKYSFPICFIGITIGAFNFLIIGNKKLDKKEQGFNMIVGFTIALVIFNVMPLVLALIAAGR